MTGNEGPSSCTYNKECFHDFPFLNATCGYILFSLSPSVCSNNIEICLCCEGSHRLHISRKPTMPYIRKYTSVSLHEKVYFRTHHYCATISILGLRSTTIAAVCQEYQQSIFRVAFCVFQLFLVLYDVCMLLSPLSAHAYVCTCTYLACAHQHALKPHLRGLAQHVEPGVWRLTLHVDFIGF